MQVLRSMGVDVFDQSLSFHCRQVGTCATRLKVLSAQNAMELEGNGPHEGSPQEAAQANLQVKQAFFEAYKDDVDMTLSDIIICSHPASLCEM